MSAPVALGSVSKSLRNLLLGEMTITPSVPVTVLGPDEPGGNRRVNLFLCRVDEHPHLRNADYRLKPGTGDTLVAPPLSLVVHYLVTAYAVNDPQTGNADAHAILGDAMRVLYEHAVIPDAHLEDDLGQAGEELRVIHVPFETEEASRLWGTFDQPFRPSVLYEVSVVQLDQSDVTERPLPERVRTIGVPEVRAPYVPPTVTGIEPVSGPAGTVVTVEGQALTGWTATVRVGGMAALTATPLDADTFDFTVPAGLDPGFHPVRIDVANLARATFFFEVT